ncbi:glycosyltransferase [Pseudarthrobacter phenanthrenivorans]|uniref:glycosyltransferase family 2 protein n=1 Tax=Pseudarthrobacter phenanthrenivorans TaxID=361575 RepID=UPI00112C48AC|nr:glycosyltransferase [Pseudarthrobacter phenanthrenivorans]TPV52176.1 glycosyltransferase [Pseudarthrobacter phenanthrenivorans]
MALDIFIPYWGDVDYTREAIDSVLAQSNADWLLTIVDDAYPGTAIRDYVATLDDSRVTYVRKDTNEGITENFRTCVALATQDVVVVMGCDDALLPNFVDVVLAAHKSFPEAWIIQPGVTVINEAGETVTPLTDVVKNRLVKPRGGGARLVSGENLAVSLLHGDWLYWPSLAFRRDRLRNFDFRDGLPVIQDLGLVMDMVLAGAVLLIEPEVCFAYRRHTSSASGAKLLDGSRFEGEREYFALAAQLCEAKKWRLARRAALLRLTSRAHALLFVPLALKQRRPDTLKRLVGHAFGR